MAKNAPNVVDQLAVQTLSVNDKTQIVLDFLSKKKNVCSG